MHPASTHVALLSDGSDDAESITASLDIDLSEVG